MPASLSPGIWYNILRGIGKLAVIINVSVLGQMGPLAQPPGSRPPPPPPFQGAGRASASPLVRPKAAGACPLQKCPLVALSVVGSSGWE